MHNFLEGVRDFQCQELQSHMHTLIYFRLSVYSVGIEDNPSRTPAH